MVPDVEAPLRHEALFYKGDDELVAATSAFLREGLSRNEPTLVVVGAAKLQRLRDELGADAARVQFADMADVGRNPVRIIPAWYEFVAKHAAPSVRLRARRSHPFAGVHESQVYEGLDAIAAPFAKPLPDAPPGAVVLELSAEALGAMRHIVAEQAARFGLDGDRSLDFVLAVNEVATNSFEYGSGTATLLLCRNGSGVVCEIRDGGRFENPLAGRRAPTSDDPRGLDLWIANQLRDLVQIRSSAEGTAVRIHLAA